MVGVVTGGDGGCGGDFKIICPFFLTTTFIYDEIDKYVNNLITKYF